MGLSGRARIVGFVVGLGVLVVSVPGAFGKATAISQQEARNWLRAVIPLPREITIERKVEVAADAIRVVVPDDAAGLLQEAAKGLAAAIAKHAGVARIPVASKPGGEAFAIVLGVLDASGKLAGEVLAGADRLGKLPNAEQAYLIAPAGQNKLLLGGLTDRAVFYASLTAKQLITARASRPRRTGDVVIPLVRVVDWPALAERGLWGGNVNADIPWLAERKLNLVESHVFLGISEDGHGVAKVDPALLDVARRHAVKVIAIITHLDQLGRTGIFERFPQTRGRLAEGQQTAPPVQLACFSEPKTVEVLGDWLVSLARDPAVAGANVWLSEFHAHCACERCRREDEFVREVRAALAGFRRARQVRPDFACRILLTQGSYASNDRILAMVPADVGISYYHGGKTYDSSREPMIYDSLARYVAKGRWLGCYPQLTASWRIVCPWSGPQFIRFRMQEFVQKGLRCLCGYATPSDRYYEFNITAAAEWAWNSDGRDEREFARAWATREGLADVEKAAEWAVTLGPVGWDVYGGGTPYPWFFRDPGTLLKGGNLPGLGDGPFRYLTCPEDIARNLAACEKAVKLAEQLAAPALIEESRVIQGFMRMLAGLHEMRQVWPASGKPDEKTRRRLGELGRDLDAAARQTVEGLKTWAAVVAPELVASPPKRFVDTVDVVERTAKGIRAALEAIGVVVQERS